MCPALYAPIVKAFNTVSENERETLKVKFDTAYFITIENIAFTKYPKICNLKVRHGVCVGSTY